MWTKYKLNTKFIAYLNCGYSFRFARYVAMKIAGLF